MQFITGNYCTNQCTVIVLLGFHFIYYEMYNINIVKTFCILIILHSNFFVLNNSDFNNS